MAATLIARLASRRRPFRRPTHPNKNFDGFGPIFVAAGPVAAIMYE